MTSETSEESRPQRRLSRFTVQLLSLLGRVRPDERTDVLAAFLTLLGFMAGHALLETARDALFLASLPARRLPWVYLAIAVLAIAIGSREPRVVRRLTAGSELGRWLLAASIVTASFWLVVEGSATWVLYALYVWSGVIASLVVVRFWTLLASRFTVTQAKRVFPVIASGSVAGAILGSGLARVVTEFVDPRHLVLAAAACFLVASTAPSLFYVVEATPKRRIQAGGLGEIGRTIWARPYLKRVAVLVLLATVSFTLVDFVFKSVADRLVDPDELGAFFASTYLSINIVSLIAQLALVGWLLRQFGLVSAVSFVPAALLVSTLGFAVGGGLTLALAMKVTDGALRHSLYRTGTELLFVPLSDRLRSQVKGVIDVLGQRGGQALASIVILMLLSTPAAEVTFAALACLTSVAWLVVASGMKPHYLDLFREALHPESERPTESYPALDVASLETLLATLNAADDRRVVAALHLLEAQGKARQVPASMLYHPSSTVVVRCLDLVTRAGQEEAIDFLPRLAQHADPDVRAAALRATSVLAPSQTTFRAATGDPEPRVRATALVSLISCGWGDSSDALTLTTGDLLADPETRRAVALGLQARPASDLEPLLLKLMVDEDPHVARAAIVAAGEQRSPGFVEVLVRTLGRRAVRDEARASIARYGALALTHLSEALGSENIPHSIRTQVPGTIALVGSAQAPTILLHHLEHESDGLIRFKLLRALGRWRREQPSFPLDNDVLQNALNAAVDTATQVMKWRRRLVQSASVAPELESEAHDVLVALLRDKQDHALERAFRLLNLQSGSDEYQRMYRGLHSPISHSRAGSRELLSHMVVPPVRGTLLTLVDDLQGEHFADDDSPATRAEALREYAEVLGEVTGCGMESASSLAAALAAEKGFAELAPALAETRGMSAEHSETLARAHGVLVGTGRP